MSHCCSQIQEQDLTYYAYIIVRLLNLAMIKRLTYWFDCQLEWLSWEKRPLTRT